jgi:hypothetical protein
VGVRVQRPRRVRSHRHRAGLRSSRARAHRRDADEVRRAVVRGRRARRRGGSGGAVSSGSTLTPGAAC